MPPFLHLQGSSNLVTRPVDSQTEQPSTCACKTTGSSSQGESQRLVEFVKSCAATQQPIAGPGQASHHQVCGPEIMPGTCASRARDERASCQMQFVFGSVGNIDTCAWRSSSLGRTAVQLDFVISIYTGR